MTSQTWKQVITKYILPNTSRSKSNQVMKFGQLIEYNMKNIFLQKLYLKCGGKPVPNSFLKIEIEHISELTVKRFIQFVFIESPR